MAKNKEHSARSKGDRRLCFERVMRRLAKQAVPSRFLISFYLCGAAIGNLFNGIYKVACFPFWRMSSSVIFVFYGFRKAVNLCIPRGRMISAPTRFNIRQPLCFCGRTKLTPTVYHLKCLCKPLLVKLFNHLTRLQCIQKVPTGIKLSGLNLFYGHSAFPERLKLTFRLWINTFRRRPVRP